MVEVRWRSVSRPLPDRQYLVFASELRLRSLRGVIRMVRRTRPVFDQLVASRGAIGFSLRAKVLGKTAWTLSVWENEADLQAFSGGQPHRQVMADLGPSLSGAKFVRWTVPGSALPPHWDEALKRLRSP